MALHLVILFYFVILKCGNPYYGTETHYGAITYVLKSKYNRYIM